jgi:hypothetical protein
MATNKTFTVAGVSTLNGVTKVRFANDFVSRIKVLAKNGHEDVNLKEFDKAMSKAEVCETLINDPEFQGEAAQGAIAEFVVRNCKDMAPKAKPAVNDIVKAEAEATPASEKDEDVLSSIKAAEETVLEEEEVTS